MIQVKYPMQYKDLFHVFLRDFLESRSNSKEFFKNIIKKNTIEVDKDYFENPSIKEISFVLKLQDQILLEYLKFLRDVEDIGKIPIQIRYIYRMAQAYDAESGLFMIPWYKLA